MQINNQCRHINESEKPRTQGDQFTLRRIHKLNKSRKILKYRDANRETHQHANESKTSRNREINSPGDEIHKLNKPSLRLNNRDANKETQRHINESKKFQKQDDQFT